MMLTSNDSTVYLHWAIHVRGADLIDITQSPIHDSYLNETRPDGWNNLTPESDTGWHFHVVGELLDKSVDDPSYVIINLTLRSEQ